jgi:hypothetical protein
MPSMITKNSEPAAPSTTSVAPCGALTWEAFLATDCSSRLVQAEKSGTFARSSSNGSGRATAGI